MGKPKKFAPEIEISEKPAALRGWNSAEGIKSLSVIEDDIRGLMRQLAEARFALGDGERQHRDSVKAILLGIIEAVDAFERVFRSIQAKQDLVTPQMKIWVGNFRTVRRLLEKTLTDQGVVKIENLDQGFDPHWHKVAEIVADPSKPEGTIVEEVVRGYVWQNQLLRKAEVIVVRNQEEAPGPASLGGP